MKLLVHCVHYPVCSGRYVTDALKRLGHEIYHVGDPTGRNIWGMMVPEEYAWHQELPPDGWQPDLAILMDTAYQWHYEGATPTVIYTVDNHVRDVRQPWIEHYFLAHKSVSITEWGDDCTWLPCCYDATAFPPSPIAWADRQFDVCMVGVMYPKRWELVQAMRVAGLKVFAGTGLVYDAYRDAYWNSRVALVSSSNGDLPIRLFEGLGLGCTVLADEIGDLWLLDSAAPIVTYKGIDEAVDLAKAAVALTGDDGVQAGVNWVQNHTWDKRAQVILDWAEARS